MSELHRYVDEHPNAVDAIPTSKTLQYLEGCNAIFERGFLSHDKIMDMNSTVLKSIDHGFKFFTNWMDQILKEGMTNITLTI